MPARQISPNSSAARAGLPARAGAGFKHQHYDVIIASHCDIGYFEVHAENFLGAGGTSHRRLTHLRERYPLSIHGVGLSLGGEDPLDAEHISRLRGLIDRYEPVLFSEHLAWCSHKGAYFNDLLPLPYTAATLRHVTSRIGRVQDALGRRILIENPATYVAFGESTFSEVDFLRELAQRTGCGLLLDVNNLYVCSVNHGFEPQDYLDAFPIAAVEEIHLAGFAADIDDNGDPLLIDAHCAPVSDAVWRLYRQALARRGPVPTLIEWDNAVPEWEDLWSEAQIADAALADATPSVDGRMEVSP
jgi:uncharacterized protein